MGPAILERNRVTARAASIVEPQIQRAGRSAMLCWMRRQPLRSRYGTRLWVLHALDRWIDSAQPSL
jgi:hypothetical protein